MDEDEGERVTLRIRAIEIELTLERRGPKQAPRISDDRLIEDARAIVVRPLKRRAA